MSQDIVRDDQINLFLLKDWLHHQHYQNILAFIEENPSWDSPRLRTLIQLGHAYVHTDLKTIEELVPEVDMDYLIEPNLLERRVYSYVQGLAVKLEIKEYDDYLRALTPLLVDVLRLILQSTVFPDLDRYLIEVLKENAEQKPIYRGLKWNESLIESDKENKIKKTWTRYYGQHFNYSHYVSSSHLLKLVSDYVKDSTILKLSEQMRAIEKHARNIVAHELVYVDDDWLRYRVNLDAKGIHQQIINLINAAGLKDPNQWQGLANIQAAILEELRIIFTNKLKQ